MSRKTTPKAFSAYRVTASTEPAMPVGGILIDKGVLLRRDWTVMNFETGKETWAVGERIGRLCPTCRTTHQRATDLGHAGDCGPDTPRFTPIEPERPASAVSETETETETEGDVR